MLLKHGKRWTGPVQDKFLNKVVQRWAMSLNNEFELGIDRTKIYNKRIDWLGATDGTLCLAPLFPLQKFNVNEHL